jgi:protein phosphatase
VAVAVLAVVVAGSVFTYSWALGHWFVGVEGSGDDGQVAVFRGLNVSVLGFDLYELESSTDIAVTDLTAAARSRARGGITADDEDDAERILDALRDQQLPVCRSESATASPTPSSAAPSSAAAPTDPAAAPTDPAATGAPAPAPTGGPVDPTPASTTSARATTSSEPGVDCREAD